MALSNKFGPMLLTTGNKSEMAVGYATLYGDMCGGYNVLKDLYKTDVYAVCALAQRQRSVRRAPSSPIPRADHRPSRRRPSFAPTRRTRTACRPTTCSTPSCTAWSRRRRPWTRSSPAGFAPATVERVQRLLYGSRVQAPPGAARGEDRRQGLRPRPALSDRQRLPRQGKTRVSSESGPASATVLDPTILSEAFRQQLRAELSTLRHPLRLVGVIAADAGPSATYAQYTALACAGVGVQFELRHATRLDVEAIVRSANEDPAVHGIMVYYPIFRTQQDDYLRESVAASKDIEGLRRDWAQCLYENRRFLDAAQTQKAILPCTPLAIMKLVQASGFFRENARPLEGRTATIFNRSEVVGRPLAAMMANDGARVISFDVDGPQLFVPDGASGPHRVEETRVDRASALAQSDIVITGVPTRDFPRVRASEIKQGALCVNFSTRKNFDPDIITRAAVFVPRVGPMTVTMALRNTLQLYRNAERAKAAGA